MKEGIVMSNHIEAKIGEVADVVLLPGDPLRAKYIAEKFLENPVCYNHIRNMFGYTGDIRSMSQGRAASTMELAQYEEVPPNVAQEIIEKRSK